MQLSSEELQRYARHLNLPDFGPDSQEKLKSARVLVVGAGGLGAPLLQYLAAAGVGTLGIADFDTVDRSNLQRQVLFNEEDIDKSKAEIAGRKLRVQNPHVQCPVHTQQISTRNALEILEKYDIIADGTDNFPTRYLLNDACVLLGKPLVYGSIYRYEGQVSVFNFNGGPNYRDLYPTPPRPELVPSCAEGGVLGVLPGIIGSLQATEVIKLITGLGEPLSGKLLLFDALNTEMRKVNIQKDPENPLTGKNPSIHALIDYEAFCSHSNDQVRTLSVEELYEWQTHDENFIIIDVREPGEFSLGNMGGVNIPSGQVTQHLDQIPSSGKVVVHCRSGARSRRVIEKLQKQYNYTHLLNLEGGLLAWKEKYDPDLVVI